MSKEVIIKLNSVGTYSVGKTSLIRRFVDNTFYEDYLPTLGVDITVKRGLIVNDKLIRLVFMDTAGEEKFGNLRKTYFEGSQGCIAVYDITRLDTFKDLDHWLKEYRTAAGDDRKITIIGNKIDLAGRRVVPEKDGRRYAKSQGTDFRETSAKFGGKTLSTIFEDLMKKCLIQISG
ncbi:MAG: Rab family GTPase [Candidatus Kariarchaeaceae archaeon]